MMHVGYSQEVHFSRHHSRYHFCQIEKQEALLQIQAEQTCKLKDVKETIILRELPKTNNFKEGGERLKVTVRARHAIQFGFVSSSQNSQRSSVLTETKPTGPWYALTNKYWLQQKIGQIPKKAYIRLENHTTHFKSMTKLERDKERLQIGVKPREWLVKLISISRALFSLIILFQIHIEIANFARNLVQSYWNELGSQKAINMKGSSEVGRRLYQLCLAYNSTHD